MISDESLRFYLERRKHATKLKKLKASAYRILVDKNVIASCNSNTIFFVEVSVL
jgi:hypothetical protein